MNTFTGLTGDNLGKNVACGAFHSVLVMEIVHTPLYSVDHYPILGILRMISKQY